MASSSNRDFKSSPSSRLLRVAQSLLRLSGRDYEISADLPARYLVGEMASRGTQLLRGCVRFRTFSFIGSSVKIRGIDRLLIKRGVSIGSGTIIDARSKNGVVLGEGSRLGRRGIITTTSHLSLMGAGVTMGARSGIGDYFHLGASGGITIGENVIVGPFFTVHSQEHVFSDPSRPIRDQGTHESAVTIGADCWIGSRVTILAGAKIGPRTVIASGAVVRGEHPGHEILAGIPARSIRDLRGVHDGG
ncbi:acyltransferase [Rhodococcus sp. HS-D2]|uniref:acyltransferase n=1 Tax=unclassified Rhodococcus (in: high G+C Gram-positive bacteria) TaxID=192944 RepID=UPI0009EE3B4D